MIVRLLCGFGRFVWGVAKVCIVLTMLAGFLLALYFLRPVPVPAPQAGSLLELTLAGRIADTRPVAGGLAAGQAAWVDATNDGGVATLVAGKAALQTTADDGDILVYAENTGSTDLYAQGVSVGGVTAGGMIARLTDVSTVDPRTPSSTAAISRNA